MNEAIQPSETTDWSEIYQKLSELYRSEYPNGAPHLFEQLLPRLPDYIRALVRRKLDLLIQDETSGASQSYADLDKSGLMAMSMFLDPQVLRAHFEVGRDSTLSNDDHSIAHIDTLPPIVAHNLITIAAKGQEAQEEKCHERMRNLENMGAIFFDVDGTKTIVDCTSHSRAGRYLEGIAKFLCKPTGTIAHWLKERKYKTEAYSYAGDEFIVVLRSDDGPVTTDILNEFGKIVQQEIAADEHMNSYVSFDHEGFVMEYAEWNDEKKEQYAQDKAAMEQEFKKARALLPDTFIPSVSFGSATFMQGLDMALSPETADAKDLEELGINATRSMVALADEKLKKDKVEFRAAITDPKWKAFLLRNGENRRLEGENAALREEVRQLKESNWQKDARIRQLEFQIRNQAAIIMRLERDLLTKKKV